VAHKQSLEGGKQMKNTKYYVVDIGDNFVLYSGTLQDCEQVLEENYGGLQIISYKNLSQRIKNQLSMAEILEDAYKEEDKQ
jgi:hypothetical protein